MKTLLLISLFIQQAIHANASLNFAHGLVSANNENTQGERQNAYLFPGFVKGTVHFRNGTKRTALLNYHRLGGQMQFLNPQADTLRFTGKYLIDYIEVEQRRFVLTDDHSDMEVIGAAGRILLAARVQPEVAGSKLSHSGQHFSASDGNAAHALMVSNQSGSFQWENNASGQHWKVKTSYFLIDQNRIAHPATRRAFMAVYARNRRQLTHYLRENRIDFGNADDLQRLLDFCKGLTAF